MFCPYNVKLRHEHRRCRGKACGGAGVVCLRADYEAGCCKTCQGKKAEKRQRRCQHCWHDLLAGKNKRFYPHGKPKQWWCCHCKVRKHRPRATTTCEADKA